MRTSQPAAAATSEVRKESQSAEKVPGRGEEVLKVEHSQEVAHGLSKKKKTDSGKPRSERLGAARSGSALGSALGSESRTLLFMELSMATVRQAAVLSLG